MNSFRLYQQLKNIYHYGQAHFWRVWYGLPDRGLHLYGVTGTNGKTTTCYVLASILRAVYGRSSVGMLTTVAFWIGEKEAINETKLTTLPSRTVYHLLRQMKNRGVAHVVVEITSHALDQNRLAGLRLDGGIMTNIAREHLDYHGTMDAYALAKQKIISYLAPGAHLTGKADDPRVKAILDYARRQGVTVHEFTSQEAAGVHTPLAGEVFKENVLAATLAARALNIDSTAIQQGVDAVRQVPGRMEWIMADKGFRVLIDYAVTPDALERLYREVRQKTSGRIFGVLGAAGLRDRGKRPDMAAAVARFADELILAREDPWTEPEEQIFSDLERGLRNTKVSWQRIVDRRAALRFALASARAGDVVIVTGKGAERGMGIGKKIIPWNDKEIILELLKELA